jgi:ribosomal protein S18 acetylase RimI-like enzyme
MTIPDYHYRHEHNATVRTEWAHAQVCDDGTVLNVETHPEHLGAGHGSALMRLVCEQADAAGRQLRLNCDPKLAGWYERFGFEPTGLRHYAFVWLAREPRP